MRSIPAGTRCDCPPGRRHWHRWLPLVARPSPRDTGRQRASWPPPHWPSGGSPLMGIVDTQVDAGFYFCGRHERRALSKRSDSSTHARVVSGHHTGEAPLDRVKLKAIRQESSTSGLGHHRFDVPGKHPPGLWPARASCRQFGLLVCRVQWQRHKAFPLTV